MTAMTLGHLHILFLKKNQLSVNPVDKVCCWVQILQAWIYWWYGGSVSLSGWNGECGFKGSYSWEEFSCLNSQFSLSLCTCIYIKLKHQSCDDISSNCDPHYLTEITLCLLTLFSVIMIHALLHSCLYLNTHILFPYQTIHYLYLSEISHCKAH